MSDRFLHLYEIVQERTLQPALIFSTASGERVKIDREVKIRMKLDLLGPDGLNHSTPVVMRGLVSPVEHNLLSVGQVARQGWCFNMDHSGCKLTMKDRKLYPVMWGSCPWIKALEDSGDEGGFASPSSSRGGRRKVRLQPHAEVVPMQVDELHAEGLKKLCQREVLPGDPEIQEGFRPATRFRVSGKSPPSALHGGKPSAEVSDGGEKPSEVEDLSAPRNRLRDREDHELFVHRLQGHASYDPRCDHCVCSRGVKQHRRRQGESDIEVAVDFGFVEASEGNQHKVLCMSERASGALGFVFCGANYETTCAEVLRWFQSIGITGPLC